MLTLFHKIMESDVQPTAPRRPLKCMSGTLVISSDKYFAGLGSVLTIEQTLMRCLKTSGG